MTFVKILDTAFQYPRIQYISIWGVSWGLPAKQSIIIRLLPLWMYIFFNCKYWIHLIFLYIFYNGKANEYTDRSNNIIKLYFGLLNLRPCGPKIVLIIVSRSGYLSHVSMATIYQHICSLVHTIMPGRASVFQLTAWSRLFLFYHCMCVLVSQRSNCTLSNGGVKLCLPVRSCKIWNLVAQHAYFHDLVAAVSISLSFHGKDSLVFNTDGNCGDMGRISLFV